MISVPLDYLLPLLISFTLQFSIRNFILLFTCHSQLMMFAHSHIKCNVSVDPLITMSLSERESSILSSLYSSSMSLVMLSSFMTITYCNYNLHTLK